MKIQVENCVLLRVPTRLPNVDFTSFFFITLVRHVADPGPPNDAKNEAKIR